MSEFLLRRRYWVPVGLAAILVVASSAIGCDREARSARDLSELAREIPTGISSRRSSDVVELQAWSDSESRQYLLWTESEPGQPERLWFAGSNGGSTEWSSEALIDSAEADRGRFVVVDSLIHVFFIDRKHRICHKVRPLNAETWQVKAVVTRDADAASDLDAIASPNGIIVTYLASPRADEAPKDSSYSKLMVATIGRDQSIAHDQVASFPPVWTSAGPSLVRWENETHLLCGLTTMVASIDSVRYIEDAYRTRLIHSYLASNTSQWSDPTVLNIASHAGAVKGSIYQVATAANADGIYLLVSYRGLVGLSSRDGRVWGLPVTVSPYPIVELERYQRTLAASADSSGVIVAWLDRRFAKEGFLTSPKVSDVLILGSQVPDADLSRLSLTKPCRLTAAGRWPRSVALGSSGKRQYVYWSELEPVQEGLSRRYHNPRLKTVQFADTSLKSP
jgi:hypothetical protein